MPNVLREPLFVATSTGERCAGVASSSSRGHYIMESLECPYSSETGPALSHFLNCCLYMFADGWHFDSVHVVATCSQPIYNVSGQGCR